MEFSFHYCGIDWSFFIFDLNLFVNRQNLKSYPCKRVVFLNNILDSARKIRSEKINRCDRYIKNKDIVGTDYFFRTNEKFRKTCFDNCRSSFYTRIKYVLSVYKSNEKLFFTFPWIIHRILCSFSDKYVYIQFSSKASKYLYNVEICNRDCECCLEYRTTEPVLLQSRNERIILGVESLDRESETFYLCASCHDIHKSYLNEKKLLSTDEDFLKRKRADKNLGVIENWRYNHTYYEKMKREKKNQNIMNISFIIRIKRFVDFFEKNSICNNCRSSGFGFDSSLKLKDVQFEGLYTRVVFFCIRCDKSVVFENCTEIFSFNKDGGKFIKTWKINLLFTTSWRGIFKDFDSSYRFLAYMNCNPLSRTIFYDLSFLIWKEIPGLCERSLMRARAELVDITLLKFVEKWGKIAEIDSDDLYEYIPREIVIHIFGFLLDKFYIDLFTDASYDSRHHALYAILLGFSKFIGKILFRVVVSGEKMREQRIINLPSYVELTSLHASHFEIIGLEKLFDQVKNTPMLEGFSSTILDLITDADVNNLKQLNRSFPLRFQEFPPMNFHCSKHGAKNIKKAIGERAANYFMNLLKSNRGKSKIVYVGCGAYSFHIFGFHLFCNNSCPHKFDYTRWDLELTFLTMKKKRKRFVKVLGVMQRKGRQTLRFVYDLDVNWNESAHAVLWRRVSKSVFYEYFAERFDMVVMYINDGEMYFLRLFEILGLPEPNIAALAKLESRLSKKRERENTKSYKLRLKLRKRKFKTKQKSRRENEKLERRITKEEEYPDLEAKAERALATEILKPEKVGPDPTPPIPTDPESNNPSNKKKPRVGGKTRIYRCSVCKFVKQKCTAYKKLHNRHPDGTIVAIVKTKKGRAEEEERQQ